MFHAVPVLVVKEGATRLSLRAAWSLEEEELSPIAEGVLERLENDAAYSEYGRLAAWLGQAIQEFQDLQDLNFPEKGRYLRANYLFFEGLSVFREAILGGLSGLIHSSLATLRSGLEMFVFYAWWKTRFEEERSHEAFYKWLEQKRGVPPFKSATADVAKAIDLPPSLNFESELRAVYEELCNYAHKPVLDESVTKIRGSNLLEPTEAIVEFWLKLLNRTQHSVLLLLIGLRPQSLFPFEIEKKFGFNPPVGWMFDEENFRPLRHALKEDVLQALIDHFEHADIVCSLKSWYQSFPTLSPEEILASWHDDDDRIEDEGKSIQEAIAIRRIAQKAKSRAIMRAFSYGSVSEEAGLAGLLDIK